MAGWRSSAKTRGVVCWWTLGVIREDRLLSFDTVEYSSIGGCVGKPLSNVEKRLGLYRILSTVYILYFAIVWVRVLTFSKAAESPTVKKLDVYQGRRYLPELFRLALVVSPFDVLVSSRREDCCRWKS